MSYKDSERYRKVYSYYRPVPRPTDPGGVSKEYVDEALRAMDWKQSVKYATTGTIVIATHGSSAIDGDDLLSDEDRILVKDQIVAAENGIYMYYASTNALSRTLDATQDALTCGATVYVESGSINENRIYTLVTQDPIAVGTTGLLWSNFAGGGSPGNPHSSVQFNDVGSFGGDPAFIFDKVTKTLTVNNISSSLTRLSDGSHYLIAGPNITINTNSLGQIEVTGSAGGGGDAYWASTTADSIYASGSVAIRGHNAAVDSPSDIGNDIFFWVSGSFDTQNRSVFGGQVHISSSLLLGDGTEANNSYGFAHGDSSKAYGDSTHAQGIFAQAFGLGSHAEGDDTRTYGTAAHAEGQGSHASGSYSHAGGIYTIASGSGQTTIGKYNLRGNDSSLFVVGDGTGDADVDRHDVFRVNAGRAEVTGTLAVTGSFEVTGSSCLAGDVFEISGSLLVSGTSHFDGDLFVTGSSMFAGDVLELSASMFVSGAVYVSGTVGVDGGILDVSGSILLTGTFERQALNQDTYIRLFTSPLGYSSNLFGQVDSAGERLEFPNRDNSFITVSGPSGSSPGTEGGRLHIRAGDALGAGGNGGNIFIDPGGTGSLGAAPGFILFGAEKGASLIAFNGGSTPGVPAGSDVFFIVSGSIAGAGAADRRAVFNGDVVTSGSYLLNVQSGTLGAEPVVLLVSSSHHLTVFTLNKVTASLPTAAHVGTQLIFKDGTGAAATSPQMVSCSVGILDGASTYTLPAVNYSSVTVVKVDEPDTWVIV